MSTTPEWAIGDGNESRQPMDELTREYLSMFRRSSWERDKYVTITEIRCKKIPELDDN